MALKELESRNIIRENLKFIMRKYNIKSQKQLAKILGVSQAMLCHVMNGEQYPTVYPFLANIENNFDCTISEFLFTDISQKLIPDYTPAKNSVRCNGVYQMHYCSENGRKLKSGVLLVGKYNEEKKASKVVLLSRLTREFGTICFEKAKELFGSTSFMDAENYLSSFSRSGTLYIGELTYSNEHMFYNLRSIKGGYKLNMTFYREFGTNQKYLGGLGTLSIVEENRRMSPSLRYVGVSSEIIPCDDMILSLLTLDDRRINSTLYEYDMMKILKTFEKGILGESIFTKDELYLLAETQMEKVLNKAIGENNMETLGISFELDEAWCRLIKSIVQKSA